jgi:cytochrome c oxidase subunit IV
MAETMHADEVRQHVRVYLMVFGALAVLTVVTVAVAYVHLPIVPALIVALFIAAIKGGLVAGYFMHLVSEEKIIHWLLWLTLGLLITMFFLFTVLYFNQEDGTILVP